MGQITPDFSEASDDSPIVDGIYSARITASEIKTSKNGNDYVKWKMQLFGAEGDLTVFNNRVVFHNTMISGPGAGMLKSLQKVTLGDSVAGAFDTDSLLGKELQVTLQTTLDDQGQKRKWPEVKAVRAVQ